MKRDARGLPLPILRVPPPASVQARKLALVRARLSAVLGDMQFPAPRWQLAMTAERYGADCSTRDVLWNLKGTQYESLEALVTEVADLWSGTISIVDAAVED
jgi:hypothetical protein